MSSTEENCSICLKPKREASLTQPTVCQCDGRAVEPVNDETPSRETTTRSAGLSFGVVFLVLAGICILVAGFTWIPSLLVSRAVPERKDSGPVVAPLKEEEAAEEATPAIPAPSAQELTTPVSDLSDTSRFSKEIGGMSRTKPQLAIARVDERIKGLESGKIEVYSGNWHDDYSDYSAIFAPCDQKLLRRIELARMWNFRGSVNALAGHNKLAEADFRESIKLFKQNSKSWANLATVLARQNRIAEADKACQMAMKINPRSPGSLTIQKELAEHGGDTKKAIAIDREIKRVAKDSRDSSSDTNLMDMGTEILPELSRMKPSAAVSAAIGLVHWQHQRYDKAEAAFRQGMEQKPPHAMPFYDMGWIANLRNQNEEALKYYDRAIEIDSTFSLAYFRKAVTYKTLKNTKNAIQCFAKFLALYPYPDNVRSIALMNRASCYYAENRMEKALSDLDAAAQLSQSSDQIKSKIHAEKAEVLKKLNRINDALKEYDIAIRLFPAPVYLKARGELQASMGDLVGGMVDLNKSNQQIASSNRLLIEAPTKEVLKELVDRQTKLLELDPNSDSLHYNRGLLRLMQEQYLLAVEDFNAVIKTSKTPSQTTDSAACLAVAALTLANKKSDAKKLLATYVAAEQGDLSPVLAFLSGKQNLKETIDQFKTVDERTSGFTALAMHLYARGYAKEASRLFKWVKKNGNVATDEYSLAVTFLPKSENAE